MKNKNKYRRVWFKNYERFQKYAIAHNMGVYYLYTAQKFPATLRWRYEPQIETTFANGASIINAWSGVWIQESFWEYFWGD